MDINILFKYFLYHEQLFLVKYETIGRNSQLGKLLQARAEACLVL